MPRAEANKEYNTFVRGLITEASELTFPENASIDEDNFVLNRDGSRQRRKGMDFEDSYVSVDTGIGYTTTLTDSISTHEWVNVPDNATTSDTIIVIRFGTMLYFFDKGAQPLSGGSLGSLDVTSFAIVGGGQGLNHVDSASGNGILIMVGQDFNPFYIEYSAPSTFTATAITTEIRDFFGIVSTESSTEIAINDRPTNLDNSHKYNLLNQGWQEGNLSAAKAYNDGAGGTSSTYPSNADIESVALDTSTNVLTPGLLNPTLFGTTPAPKGHYIIDAFTRGASRVSQSGIAGLSDDKETSSFRTVGFFGGRVFYSGIASSVSGSIDTSPDYSGFIFFSQVLTNNEKIGRCYQEADPTSNEISDLVATDGGTIPIPDANSIRAITALGNSLLVFAENGVWEISGGDSGFSATNYQLRKITNAGVLSPKSVVIVESSLLYWSTSGIYVVSPDEISGYLTATNITQSTIQTLYDNIKNTTKEHVVGIYEKSSKIVRWLYNDLDGFDGINYRDVYNRELCFDTVLTAFYTNTIKSITAGFAPVVSGFVETGSTSATTVVTDIVDSGVDVTDGGVQVTDTLDASLGNLVSIKYLTLTTANNAASGNYFGTFSEYNDTDFLDWATADSTGVSYDSYLLTGYELMGDSTRDKQATYITTHFKRTETGFTDDGSGNLTAIGESGCLMQSRWNWANHINSGQYQPLSAFNEAGTARYFQAYRLNRNYLPSGGGDTFDYGYSVVSTKNKVRGSGKSLSLYFLSEQGKDMHLLGWGSTYSGNTKV
jgi:hypothetical protein